MAIHLAKVEESVSLCGVNVVLGGGGTTHGARKCDACQAIRREFYEKQKKKK